jgi:beta-glucanase (GH16 family)
MRGPPDMHNFMKSSYDLVATLILIFFLGVPITLPAQSNSADSNPARWTLVWSDEFNESRLDTSKWVYDIGGGKWGNRELEYYTNRPENVAVHDGHLVITARQEKFTDPDRATWEYSSARIKTQGKFSQSYGRFEARIKVPHGQGMWPAFWMLGQNINQADWPGCGEIDIMEYVGKKPSTVYGTIHGSGYSGEGGLGSEYSLPNATRFADDFHIFGVEWERNAIRFYVDNHLYATRTRTDIPRGRKWAFDQPFFMLLNLAVGGDWPGNPDVSTVFPQTMLVDYVRVYRASAP